MCLHRTVWFISTLSAQPLLSYELCLTPKITSCFGKKNMSTKVYNKNLCIHFQGRSLYLELFVSYSKGGPFLKVRICSQSKFILLRVAPSAEYSASTDTNTPVWIWPPNHGHEPVFIEVMKIIQNVHPQNTGSSAAETSKPHMVQSKCWFLYFNIILILVSCHDN